MVIWIAMINRPFIRNYPYKTYNRIVELRTIFNKTLEEEARKSKFSLVLYTDDLNSNPEFFDDFGNLTYLGKQKFWRNVDYYLKRCENNQESLKPWQRKDNGDHHKAHPRNYNEEISGQAAIMSCMHNETANRHRLHRDKNY